MKKKKSNKKLVPVTLKYHYDNKYGHHHVILESLDDKYLSVGLTTDSKKGKNSTNYKLGNNPLYNGKKESYMRRQATIAKKYTYHGNKNGFMLPADYDKAKSYGKKCKEKYFKKNKK